jgi:peptide deformylase
MANVFGPHLNESLTFQIPPSRLVSNR